MPRQVGRRAAGRRRVPGAGHQRAAPRCAIDRRPADPRALDGSRRRVRGAGAVRPELPSYSPDVWFSMAHECGLGAMFEARAVDLALRAGAERPAGTLLSVNVSPSVLSTRELHDVLPFDLVGTAVRDHREGGRRRRRPLPGGPESPCATAGPASPSTTSVRGTPVCSACWPSPPTSSSSTGRW